MVEKVRGRKLSLKGIANRMKETSIRPEEQEVYIGHGDSRADAEARASRIREIALVKNIYIAPTRRSSARTLPVHHRAILPGNAALGRTKDFEWAARPYGSAHFI